MRRSTGWWLAWSAMMAIDVIVVAMVSEAAATPWRAAARDVLMAVGILIPALFFAAFTRFRRVWFAVVVWLITVTAVAFGATFARPARAADSPATEYLATVRASIYRCIDAHKPLVQCYVEGSPKRCQQQALNLFNADIDRRLTMWALCVESCADSDAKDCRRKTY